jgi:hypothetical protein
MWNKDNVLGKKICVGIVYLDEENKISDRVQNYGTIFFADDETVHYKLAETEEPFVVPAYYDSFEIADKSLVYILEDTQKQVVDVDIIATFTVLPQQD